MSASCDRQNDPHKHGNAHLPSSPRLTDYPYDGFELGVLRILRFFLMSFQAPKSQPWIDGFQYADQHFGPEKGPLMAKAIMDITCVLRGTRTSDIQFYNPYCRNCSAHITREECHMISTLYCLRRHLPQTRSHAMMLCEGADDTQLLERIRKLIDLAHYLDPFAAERQHTYYQ